MFRVIFFYNTIYKFFQLNNNIFNFNSGVTKINIIFMQNLNIIKKQYVKRIFDLKGSTVDRITKNIEKTDKMTALKDLDFLWMKKIYSDVN